MKLLNRKPAPPVTQLPVPDALAASYHGITEAGWYRLTDRQRAKYRDSITHGQRFNQENR